MIIMIQLLFPFFPWSLHRAFAVPSHPTKERIKEFEAAAERSKDLSNYVNRYP
jgi:hypothetical protein